MSNPLPKSAIVLHSATDILAVGDADRYAEEKGINTQKKRISGVIRLSKTETLDLMNQLSHQK
jgi:hypothetical protein